MAALPSAAAPPAPPFCCTVSKIDADRAEAVLRGELDLANSPLLRDELLSTLDEGLQSLILDLSELTFIDSSGLAVLVVVLKHADDHHIALRLRSVTPPIERVLEACGLDDLFQRV
jgi:anti-sigma B factor antagonist